MEVEIGNDSSLIPRFVQTWHPSVRRPITLPPSATYHESIDPHAIFELRESDSSDYIYVVPHRCTFCISTKQACSRLLPCARCRNTTHPCHASQPGYQKLPPPKVSKKRASTGTEPTPCIPSVSQSKRQAALRSNQFKTAASHPRPSAKKLKQTSTSFLGPSRGFLEPKGGIDVNPPPQSAPPRNSIARSTGLYFSGSPSIQLTRRVTETSTSASMAPIWVPMGPVKPQCTNDTFTFASTAPFIDPPRTPRVWANSPMAIASIFPELMKSVTGISWQRFDTPTLFLEHPGFEDLWKDDNTLEITRCWSYKCGREKLEGSNLCNDKHNGTRVECGSVDDIHTSLFSSTLQSTLLPFPPPAVPALATPKIQPLILPVEKPPEVENLAQCRACDIPLLVFVSQESGLLPHPLPTEYACVCLGFFFISDINVEMIDTTTSALTHVMGNVRWRITLEWAPGGEEGLVEDVNVRSYPWWIDPVAYPAEDDAGSVTMRYLPRDLNEQYYSFLPLDLLADFKPAEFLPKGWYCRKCGMLNTQQFFRHQICQSSRCKRNLERGKAISDGNALTGHVDSLQTLRGPQQFLSIRDPLDVAPAQVSTTIDTWDDGMRTFTYEINEGARVKHVFTGNQAILQQDATGLLLAIQKDVILSRSNLQSPCFSWSTESGPGQAYTGDAQGALKIPRPIFDIQGVLLRYMQGYGDIEYRNVNHILIQAWATPGSKRGSLFKATSQAITILCLGAEVVVNLVPKRGFGGVSTKSAEEPMETNVDSARILNASRLAVKGSGRSPETAGPVIDIPDSEVACRQGDFCAMSPPHPASQDVRAASGLSISLGPEIAKDNREARQKEKGGKTGGKLPLELSLTLVHGDATILEGDNFECQIKRSGSTILLIGSSEVV